MSKTKNTNMKDFFQKNLNKYHVIGIVICLIFSIIYWYKSGQFSENFLKNSPVLMAIWGILVGYITADLLFNAKNRKDKE